MSVEGYALNRRLQGRLLSIAIALKIPITSNVIHFVQNVRQDRPRMF
jgi:hypothetical protein